jgi:protein Hikeshi
MTMVRAHGVESDCPMSSQLPGPDSIFKQHLEPVLIYKSIVSSSHHAEYTSSHPPPARLTQPARRTADPAATMFGILISGRPVQTAAETLSPTQLAFRLPASPPFNHLAVFLLPEATLPAGSAAAVYLQAPPSAAFALLGALSADKPSAIFRVALGDRAAAAAAAQRAEDADAMLDVGPAPAAPASGGGAAPADLTIGISLEPVEQVDRALAELRASRGGELVHVGASAPSALTKKVLAQRIIGNAFDFLASFGSDVVPLKAFEEWWKKFERKIEADPTFLEREVGA